MSPKSSNFSPINCMFFLLQFKRVFKYGIFSIETFKAIKSLALALLYDNLAISLSKSYIPSRLSSKLTNNS